MSAAADAEVPRILKSYESDLLEEWMREQLAGLRSGAKIRESELRQQSTEFLSLLQTATQAGNVTDINAPLA